MTDYEDGAGVYTSEDARRNRRRKQIAIGAVGLAAVLGGGAYFVTSEVTAKEQIAADPAPIAPVEPAASTSMDGTPDSSPPAALSSSAAPAPSITPPSPAAGSASMSVQQHIDAAKG